MDETTSGVKGRVNPFFVPYNTPHDTVPFNKITIEDYEEAFNEGIKRDNEAIEKIVNDPEEPTFDNTIARVDTSKGEHYYDLLDRVSNVFSCMLSAETTDALDELAQKMSPILNAHANDVMLNRKFFDRIKAVYDHHRPLTGEEEMLLTTTYEAFVNHGALLADEDKEKLRRITEEASICSLQFSQNLLKEQKNYKLHVTDAAQLDGLPETAVAAAAETAAESGLEGWVFTLDYPSYSPFITYSTRRELRKQMFFARNTVCMHDDDLDNRLNCSRLVNLRREVAQLMGYKTYAEYVLKHRMASTTANVYKLLDDLVDAYKPKALEETADVKAIAKRLEGEDFEMQPWDFAYYAHKLKMERFNLDAE